LIHIKPRFAEGYIIPPQFSFQTSSGENRKFSLPYGSSYVQIQKTPSGMMARGSSILGHILTTHLPPPRSKKGYGSLVHREIYFKPENSKETLPTQRTCPVALMVSIEVKVGIPEVQISPF
jgi:hypothetical protein